MTGISDILSRERERVVLTEGIYIVFDRGWNHDDVECLFQILLSCLFQCGLCVGEMMIEFKKQTVKLN